MVFPFVSLVSFVVMQRRYTELEIALTAQASPPIIVKLVETPRDPTGLADVLIGALGLTGALLVMALVLGLLAGGILYFARSRHPLS
jgi:hypothetical protein